MKDAKGHGSDGKGGPASYQNVSTKPLLTNAARARQIAFTQAAGKDMTEGQRQWLASQSPQDHAAATELSRGNPKAAAAPVHPGASGPQYNREAVNNAIASSNRAGRRIGGREAGMIHALLKGRH